MRTDPSWGEDFGVVTVLSEALRGLNSAYINLEKDIHLGVDGLQIEKAEIQGDKLKIEIKSVLHQFNIPWDKQFSAVLNIEGLIQDRM